MSAASGAETPAHGSHEWIMARAEELWRQGETAPRLARDPVNQPQIHTWLEAIGDANPIYRDTAGGSRDPRRAGGSAGDGPRPGRCTGSACRERTDPTARPTRST